MQFSICKHSRGDAVVALIVIEAKRRIGVDRIEPTLLHLIGAHLVGQAEPAALLRQIENDAAAYIVDAREREFQLVAAIAPSRAEDVAGEASGMQTHGNRFGEGGFSDNDGDRTAAHRVAENDETCARSGIERD